VKTSSQDLSLSLNPSARVQAPNSRLSANS
jgi:hypothetical protein